MSDAEHLAHLEARYQAALRLRAQRPYWQWCAIADARCCDLCRELHGKVFHHSDPIWQHMKPPIHEGCRCRFRTLSERRMQIERPIVHKGDEYLHRYLKGEGLMSYDNAWVEYIHQIETATARRDFDTARMMLQKIAYGMVGPEITEEQRTAFKQVMADFARVDPLYNEILGRIMPIVSARPGIMQTEAFKQLAQYDVEWLRYTTYFAHELGHLHRNKKGRSYALFPPGAVIDG